MADLPFESWGQAEPHGIAPRRLPLNLSSLHHHAALLGFGHQHDRMARITRALSGTANLQLEITHQPRGWARRA